jgi:hypothetical protein
MPESPTAEALHNALALHRRGAIAEAAAIYPEVQHTDPRNADAPFYLATISCQQIRFAQSAAPRLNQSSMASGAAASA